MTSPRRMALLIDADNVWASAVNRALQEAGKHGTVTVRRAYQLWTDGKRKAWEAVLDQHAILPVQVQSGRNAADMAIAIDAMDLMHGGRIEGVCIVSSDGDFTRLAQRMREHGIFVLAVGAKPSERLRAACDLAVPIPSSAKSAGPSSSNDKPAVPKKAKDTSGNAERVKAYCEAIAASDRDGDRARLIDVDKLVPEDLRPKASKEWLHARPEFVVRKHKFKTDSLATDCVRIAKKA